MSYGKPELTLVGAAQNLVLGPLDTSVNPGDLCFYDSPTEQASDIPLAW